MESVFTVDEKWCLYVNIMHSPPWVDKDEQHEPQPKAGFHLLKVMSSVSESRPLHIENGGEYRPITAALCTAHSCDAAGLKGVFCCARVINRHSTIAATVIAGFYKKAVFTWGLSTSSELNDPGRFPSISVLSVSSFSLAVALRTILLQFHWTQFAFVYSNTGNEQLCETMKNDLQVKYLDIPSLEKLIDHNRGSKLVISHGYLI
ncbi:hypothetical protein Y032_0224g2701 [Ancylostoma ceylanicum]|uniref:Receptor ligand binding region domain-containing protein n=1 Tax=Ancylostoma ceylanicum TaxID=53326 RepID=A0A016SI48_9BILA|nr:hypothetical protein Y032_0224g2701 [Ancylostoma ceylanicum]